MDHYESSSPSPAELPKGKTGPGFTHAEREPVAIIGIGCRFPGNVNTPQQFWQLLCRAGDAVVEIPPDRWSIREFYDPEAGIPGKTNSRWAGFLEGIDQFDATFFGISPREAACMDPQQRLLLEVAYEAIEDGGQTLEHLAGSATGVFIGLSTNDYGQIQSSTYDKSSIDTHVTTGTVASIPANRISWAFDLRGPSLVIDTACSSSLVAVHLACQSLWRKESSIAFAGGVNVILLPDPFIGFSKLSMLSPEGRCKAFDASGNGFVRAEGAGIILLKPLRQAIAEGDAIYALILGTAVNQDGHTSGITVPSEAAQQAMLRQACEESGVAPEQIQYVEAHGTGTVVGDPIEANALGAVLSAHRPAGNECIIGSVKTNIGHLEAGAGIAGVIKVALSLKHKMIPPNLHLKDPNPYIHFEELKLKVQQELGPWPASDGPALAAVNSFGFGGTNANAILSEAPREEGERQRSAAEGGAFPCIVPFSARSTEALQSVARVYKDFLAAPTNGVPFTLQDLASQLSLRRSHHPHRLAVVASTKDELRDKLEAFLAGENRQGSYTGHTLALGKPKLAFVFSGQGPQWWGMGRELLEHEPVFRDMIEKCDALLPEDAGWSLLEELLAPEERSRMHVTSIAQPAIFALQVALAALWRSWGVVPEAVLGHSVGEVAAAHVAGILDLKDALRVIYHRGRCMDLATSLGKMLGAGLTRNEAEQFIQGYEDRVSLAAINSPSSVTLSGEAAALDELALKLERQGVFFSFLRVNYAFHSPQMDPVHDELLRSLRNLQPDNASLPMYSTVSGHRADGAEFGAEYWWHNVRQPVQFADAIKSAIDDGCNLFVEVGPHPALSSYVVECLHESHIHGHVFPSLRRKENEQLMMLGSLGALHAVGYPVEWATVYAGPYQQISLPRYQWQHESLWHENAETRDWRLGRRAHPLLGRRLKSADPSWSIELHRGAFAYLHDHRVQGHVVFPAAAYVETAFAVARETIDTRPWILENVQFHKALFLPDSGASTLVQTTMYPGDNSFAISSRADGSGDRWTLHATGRIRSEEPRQKETRIDVDAVKRRCQEAVSKEDCYRNFRKRGLLFGPAFQGIQQIWRRDGEALGAVRFDEGLDNESGNYVIHPALLDSCLQVLSEASIERSQARNIMLLLPVQIEQVRLLNLPHTVMWSRATILRTTEKTIEGNIQLLDEQGNQLVEIRGLKAQSVDTITDAASEVMDTWLYEFRWQLSPRANARKVTREVDYLPPMAVITKSLQTEIAAGDRNLSVISKHAEAGTALNTLCAAYIVDALRELGLSFSPHEHLSLDGIAQQLAVPAQCHRLLQSLMNSLTADGILANEESGWEVIRVPEEMGVNYMWKQTLHRFPALYAELMLISTYGERLVEHLQGKVSPADLIPPDGSSIALELFSQDSPSHTVSRQLVKRAVSLMASCLPEGRHIRILEVAGGTAGIIPHILPLLPHGQVDYVFSTPSQDLLRKAELKFKDSPNVTCRTFALEMPPEDQGMEPQSFDLILATGAMHRTSRSRKLLQTARTLLKPGGMLVFSEPGPDCPWRNFVLGLHEGWWISRDGDVERGDPLHPQEHWLQLLRESGFVDLSVTPEIKETNGFGESVFIARSPMGQMQGEVGQEEDSRHAKPQREKRWLVFADHGGTGRDLATALASQGERCILAFPGKKLRRLEENHFELSPDRPEDFRELLTDYLAVGQSGLDAVVHCWNLDAMTTEATTTASLMESVMMTSQSVAYFVQAWAGLHGIVAPQLWLITAGAQPIGHAPTPISVAQSPACGLGRVIMNEHPDFHCRLVDLSPHVSRTEIDALVEEMLSPDDEDEIALRGEARYVQRLSRKSLKTFAHSEMKSVNTTSTPVQLQNISPGVLDNLTFHYARRREPGKGEVEIRVAATALNFRDVMKAIGIYPTETNEEMLLGDECAGSVLTVGEGVDHLHAGDEVVAIAPGSFRSSVTTNAALAVRIPSNLGPEEAVTMPIAFLTAYYALHHLGRIQQGERVLIHAAAGGVGLAAVQIAHLAGAEVFATAGSPEKRRLLRSLGVRYVMDSRSLSFADEVLQYTEGKGVDLVLNSLAGEAIDKGLSCLRACGRFLEIGKRDIYQNRRLELRRFKNNLSYFAIDLAQILAEQPRLAHTLFLDLMDLSEKGKLHPLPYRVYAADRVVSAFREMSQARHIGKIVVSMRDQQVAVAPSPEGTFSLDADSTYLITGGLGGFGLAVARWMVEKGARHIVLMGRTGATSEEARETVAALRRTGAQIVIELADVAREDDVARVLAAIRSSLPPLRGIVHAAMVLDDGIVLHLDHDRFKNVLEPKVLGTWNLHSMTRDLPLKFFVLFSSVTTMFGIPGQGNYGAANAFLDALAHHRRRMSLPALTVNWGILRDTGYIARHSDLSRRLDSSGIRGFNASQALQVMEKLLLRGSTQIGVMDVDWQQWAKLTPSHTAPRFSLLIRPETQELQGAEGFRRVYNDVLAAPAEERQQILESYLKDQVARVLGMSPSKVESEQPLSGLGLDSLMMVELKNRIEKETGVVLSTVELMRGPTIRKLSAMLIEHLFTQGSPAPDQASTGPPDTQSIPTHEAQEILQNIDKLSEKEVDDLLARLTDEGNPQRSVKERRK